VWVQHPFRLVEAKFYVDALIVLGVHGLPQVNGVDVLVVPARHGSFYAELTPSCSALSPALALMVLSMTLPKRNWPGTTIPASRWRRPVAVAAAVGVVILGNMLRIDSCIVVGLLAGSASLVLFHNWIGAIFGFAAVLGGYILMLWVVLPDELTLQALRARASETNQTVLHGDAVVPERTRHRPGPE
jgi:exosortase/archaeosortase family protein